MHPFWCSYISHSCFSLLVKFVYFQSPSNHVDGTNDKMIKVPEIYCHQKRGHIYNGSMYYVVLLFQIIMIIYLKFCRKQTSTSTQYNKCLGTHCSSWSSCKSAMLPWVFPVLLSVLIYLLLPCPINLFQRFLTKMTAVISQSVAKDCINWLFSFT